MRPGESLDFTYNKRNRPVSVTRNSVAYATYGYNALQQLATRSTTAAGEPTGQVAYIYDLSGHLIAEATASTGVVTRDYIWMASNDNTTPTDLPLAVADISGTTSTVFMVHTDHLGRPIRMTDGAKSTVWQATYKPFGEVQTTSGTKALNVRFPGQYFQIETNLAYNWHRHYDPTTGRYTQPDPLRFVDGPNIYRYAGNSPFMRVDRSGLDTTIVIWGADGWVGDHSGIVITGKTPDGNAIYDPSGTGNFPEGGSGRLSTGSDSPSLTDYTGGPNCGCKTYTFPTTPKDEAEIIKRAETQGGGGFAQCTNNVRSAISGIGPFRNIGAGWPFSWPASLGRDLGATPGVKMGTGK